MNRTNTILTVASVTVAGLAAYAVYFDYRRRNDPEFRRRLRKDKKRARKSAAQSKENLVGSASGGVSPEQLREALEAVKNEEPVQSAAEKENYFMTQVAMGEQLAARGPEYHLAAALSFYRALRVYPSPIELINIYNKTVPEPIFKLVMELTNLDVSTPSFQIIGGEVILVEDNHSSETSPVRGMSGPPSETSSQEWDKLTDPGIQTPASVS